MYVFVASVQRRLMTAIFHLWWFPWAEPFGRAKELWKFRLKLLWSHSLLDSILLNVPPKNDRGCPQQHDFCLLDNWIWRHLAIKLIPARNDASKSIQKLCAKSQRYHTHTQNEHLKNSKVKGNSEHWPKQWPNKDHFLGFWVPRDTSHREPSSGFFAGKKLLLLLFVLLLLLLQMLLFNHLLVSCPLTPNLEER